jgi:lipopolysaccharide biosynthesis protein
MGKCLLERPFEELLKTREPEFPFCLCWANESWTRSWDGRSGEILILQEYSEMDDLQHIHWLAQAFRDERYIRIGGKPLMLVYRANQLPNPERTSQIWREEAKRLGIGDIYLCAVESFPDEHADPSKIGFDAAVEFQPDWTQLGQPLRSRAFRDHLVYRYEDVVNWMLKKEDPGYKRFRCVTPSWDNSPRRKKNAVIFIDSAPELYERWLAEVIKKSLNNPPEEKVIFINAWNEWGEGNHLEPDLRFGRGYLEATRRALEAHDHVTEKEKSQ